MFWYCHTKPGSLGKYGGWTNRNSFHIMWGNLMHNVKNGKSALEAVHGMSNYEVVEHCHINRKDAYGHLR